MYYVIKAAVADEGATQFSFRLQKTMYGGKHIRAKDEVFIFASENEGGRGLIARGIVVSVTQSPVRPNPPTARITPRVSIRVRRIARAKRALGRDDLRPFRAWHDGRPETELCFKFYRQATNKVAGVTDKAAQFLRSFF